VKLLIRDWRVGCGGTTLIELVIVVGILAVLLGLASSSFTEFVTQARLYGEARRLLSSVHLVRSEAIKRNQTVSICPSKMAETGQMRCEGSYSSGWMIFSNPGNKSEPTSAEQLIGSFGKMHSDLRVLNRKGTRDAYRKISYFPDGSGRRNLTWMVCSFSHPDSDSWSVVISVFGKPRFARDWGECPS
jgi:type IV fimbrial biogenesis protein FimT